MFFSAILLEFCSIRVKLYKNLHFTEFHSLLKYIFEEKSYLLPLYLMEYFLNHCPSPSRYSNSQLAWLYIHKRSWHNKWGPIFRGGGNVIHDLWNLGKGEGNDGDTKYIFLTFDLFTLSINIHLTIQWFHVFSSIFSWKLRIIPYNDLFMWNRRTYPYLLVLIKIY